MSFINEILRENMNVTLAISAAELREVLTEWATQLLASHPQKEVDDEDLKLLTRDEAAELLHVNLATLWRWNKEGYLPAVKVGSKTMYRKDDLAKILRTRK